MRREGSNDPEPPPPEVLEQLGIEPHCTCSGGQQREPEPASVREGPARTAPQIIKPTSAKENAMRDIATAALSGNVTREVELRELPSGTDVARLRVATTTRRHSGEEWVEKTNYFTVEVYGAQARRCAQYLRKGLRVLVDAELDWREWTDQQNNRREAVTLRARQVICESGRPPADRGEDGGEHNGSAASAAEPGTTVGAITHAGEASEGAEDVPF